MVTAAGGEARSAAKLLLFEHHGPNAALQQTWLVAEGERLSVIDAGARVALPDGALEAVFRRYGRPLAEPLTVVEVLELGPGARVYRGRYRPRFDVIARDYLVLEGADQEPSCELSTTIAAALIHLGRALAGRTPS